MRTKLHIIQQEIEAFTSEGSKVWAGKVITNLASLIK